MLLGSAEGHEVERDFGLEVAGILRELGQVWPRMIRNHKAKRLLLAKHLHELRRVQQNTVSEHAASL